MLRGVVIGGLVLRGVVIGGLVVVWSPGKYHKCSHKYANYLSAKVHKNRWLE